MVKLPFTRSFRTFFPSKEFLLREVPGAFSYLYEEAGNLTKLGKKIDKMVSKDTPFPKFGRVLRTVAEVGYNIGKTDKRISDVYINHLYGEEDLREISVWFREFMGRDFTEYFARALKEKLSKRMIKEIGEDRIKAILG